jgi:hypothetical protein
MTALLPALALLFALDAPPEPARGWASAYAPGVMEDVIALRAANGWWHYPPPIGWYQQVDGAIAEIPCTRVGAIVTMTAGGETYRVLVADCAGADGHPERFEEDNIVAELDARLWARLTAEHGRPLRVEVGP